MLDSLYSIGQTGAGLIMLYPCQTLVFCALILAYSFLRAARGINGR